MGRGYLRSGSDHGGSSPVSESVGSFGPPRPNTMVFAFMTPDGGAAVQPPGLSYTAHWEALGSALHLLTTRSIPCTGPVWGWGSGPSSCRSQRQSRSRLCRPLHIFLSFILLGCLGNCRSWSRHGSQRLLGGPHDTLPSAVFPCSHIPVVSPFPWSNTLSPSVTEHKARRERGAGLGLEGDRN